MSNTPDSHGARCTLIHGRRYLISQLGSVDSPLGAPGMDGTAAFREETPCSAETVLHPRGLEQGLLDSLTSVTPRPGTAMRSTTSSNGIAWAKVPG
jgi:hypothetical protein